MADNDVDVNEELLDYEDEPTEAVEAGAENGAATKQVRDSLSGCITWRLCSLMSSRLTICNGKFR